MKNQCDKIKDKLSAYLDGELSADEMAEVAAHLETCPDCPALLEKMRRLDDMAGTAIPEFDDDLMESLAGRIMEGIDASEQTAEEPHPKPRVIPIWYKYVAVAASIVIVFLAGRMAFKESGGNLLKPPARHEMMPPAADDTMMPYQESEGAADQAKMAKPQTSPPSVITQGAGEEKSAATREKGAARTNERQAPASETENVPAPATTESPPPVEKPAVQADHQSPTNAVRKISAAEPGKKAESRGKIAGRIVDSKTGEPLFGVAVQLKGTTIGAKSNLDGDFTILSVPPDTYDLVYSSPGYESLQYTDVPVYPGQTEELTVAMEQSVLEMGKVTEVRGTRKSIDFLETGTRTKETGETTKDKAAAMAVEQTVAAKVALPDVDSLEAQYVSRMNEYWKAVSERGRKSMAAYKSAKAEPRLADDLQKVIDSLSTEIAKTENPAERIEVSYLRLRAALDLYNETGKTADKKRLESYKADFERELSDLQEQGYDRKTLDAYRSRIEQMERRK